MANDTGQCPACGPIPDDCTSRYCPHHVAEMRAEFDRLWASRHTAARPARPGQPSPVRAGSA